MLSPWVSLGLLILGVEGGKDYNEHRPHTVIDITTITSSKTVAVTHYVDVTIPHYVNITKTNTAVTCITEYKTTTLHFTVSTTETDLETVTNTKTDLTTITNTKTDLTTITNTKTDLTTVTNTETDTTTVTVPATITTYTTETVVFTTVDRCPTTCSISAGTVTVFFWPTDRPHTYPPTYVHPTLGYTFVSPSVYLLIDTARGTNTRGQPAGPSTASWLLPLNLEDVSTIVSKTLTRQLSLSDLGTDCPQTIEPSAIATLAEDPRCNPILAAPKQVSTWAYPCNACGRFGLFDPPYAVPTLTGGLVVTTTPPPPPPGTTAPPVPTFTPAPPPATTTTRVAPVPVPASATRAMNGLVWLIPSVLIAAFLM